MYVYCICLYARWEFIKENKKVRKKERKHDFDQVFRFKNINQIYFQQLIIVSVISRFILGRYRFLLVERVFSFFFAFLFSFINSHLSKGMHEYGCLQKSATDIENGIISFFPCQGNGESGKRIW